MAGPVSTDASRYYGFWSQWMVIGVCGSGAIALVIIGLLVRAVLLLGRIVDASRGQQ